MRRADRRPGLPRRSRTVSSCAALPPLLEIARDGAGRRRTDGVLHLSGRAAGDDGERTERAQENPRLRRTDPRNVREARFPHAPGTPAAVPGDREAVGLVPKALDELQRRVFRREPDRVRPVGSPDLLLSLRQTDRRDLDSDAIEGGQGSLELPSPPIDEDEIRHRPPLVPHAPVAALDRLRHALEIIGREKALGGDPEEPVIGFFRLAVLEDDDGRDAVGSLEVRDVEGLDAPRRDGQIERAREPLDSESFLTAHAAEPNAMPLLRVRVRELYPIGARASLRHAHRDPGAPSREQERLEEVHLPEEGVCVVELGKKRVEKRRRVDLLRFFEEELASVLKNARAHDEHADRDVSARLEESEDVGALPFHRLDELPLRDVFHRAYRVPIGAGHLEALPRGRALPLRLEARDELAISPLKEEQDVSDRTRV